MARSWSGQWHALVRASARRDCHDADDSRDHLRDRSGNRGPVLLVVRITLGNHHGGTGEWYWLAVGQEESPTGTFNLAVWLVVFAISRYVSLASIASAITLPIAALF